MCVSSQMSWRSGGKGRGRTRAFVWLSGRDGAGILRGSSEADRVQEGSLGQEGAQGRRELRAGGSPGQKGAADRGQRGPGGLLRPGREVQLHIALPGSPSAGAQPGTQGWLPQSAHTSTVTQKQVLH